MARMNREGLKDVKDLIASYVPEFRERMLLSPEEVASPEALERAVSALEGEARDLAEALIIGVGGGQTLPERFQTISLNRSVRVS